METKYGNGHQRTDGYIQITSGPYKGKLLHRLIYEEVYGSIPKGYSIHHLDMDKTNNNPGNLVALSKSHHHSIHNRGTRHPRWDNGRIDEAGGLTFLSAEKNKGQSIANVADDLGYTNAAPVYQYLHNRNMEWNEL